MPSGHDRDETRERRPLAGQDVVDLLAALVLFALLRFDDGDPADFPDEFEAHVGDGGGAVEASLLLHLFDDVLDGLFLILIEAQGVFDALIAFDEFMGGKTERDVRCGRVVFDQVHGRVQGAVHGAAVVVLITEISAGRLFLIAGDVDGVAHKFVDAFAGQRIDGDDRDAERRFKFIEVDRAAVVDDLVEEVQGDDHRRVQFEELHRKVQVPLDVRTVDDVDDTLRFFPQDELSRDDLFAGVGRHRVDARKVGHKRFRMLFDLAVFPVHRDAGEVPDVLVRTGQLVEQCRFSAVLVAGQCKSQDLALRQRRLRLAVVVLAAFAEAGVFDMVAADPLDRGPVFTDRGRFLIVAGTDGDPDVRGIRQTEAQLIAVDAQFHRVPHRRVTDQLEARAGQDAHIEEMLPESAFAAYTGDDRGLSDFQFVQSHKYPHQLA